MTISHKAQRKSVSRCKDCRRASSGILGRRTLSSFRLITLYPLRFVVRHCSYACRVKYGRHRNNGDRSEGIRTYQLSYWRPPATAVLLNVVSSKEVTSMVVTSGTVYGVFDRL